MSPNKSQFHSFTVADAKNHGVEKAIILQNMRYWLDKHLAHNEYIKAYENPASEYHGAQLVWSRVSGDGLENMFGYIGNASKFRRLLRELESAGIIVSQQFDKKGHNQTKSYSIPHEYRVFKNEHSNVQELTIDRSEMNTQSFKNEHSLRSNKRSNKDLSLSIEPEITNANYDQIEPVDLAMSDDFVKVCKVAGCVADAANLFEMFAGHHVSRMTSPKTLVQWLGEWRKWCAREKSYQRPARAQAEQPKKINSLDGWEVRKWGE